MSASTSHRLRRTLFDRKMPAGLTWWHTLGSATLAVFIVQVATGIVLAMYYSPSPDHAYDSIRYLAAERRERRHACAASTIGARRRWWCSPSPT